MTSVVETAEQLLDQRHLDAASLAELLRQAQEASERFADEEDIEVAWERIWSIEPILFDPALIGLCDDACREVAGVSHRLPSGPLHDAAEVARAGVPTVMLFVQSLRGLSHTKLEDTQGRAPRARASRRSTGWPTRRSPGSPIGSLTTIAPGSAGQHLKPLPVDSRVEGALAAFVERGIASPKPCSKMR